MVGSREQRISLFLLILFVLGVVSAQALNVYMNPWVCMQRSEKKVSHSIALYFLISLQIHFVWGVRGVYVCVSLWCCLIWVLRTVYICIKTSFPEPET